MQSCSIVKMPATFVYLDYYKKRDLLRLYPFCCKTQKYAPVDF